MKIRYYRVVMAVAAALLRHANKIMPDGVPVLCAGCGEPIGIGQRSLQGMHGEWYHYGSGCVLKGKTA